MGQPIVDPITGLPYDITNPLIDQLPMDSTPIPLDDWATQGKINQYYYPDMIPATLATIGAQDRTNVQKAQSLQTDGDHALRVNVANAGAIGGGGVPSISARQIPQLVLNGGVPTYPTTSWTERYLYGYTFSLVTDDVPSTTGRNWAGATIISTTAGVAPNLTIVGRWFVRDTTTQGNLEIHESMTYPTRLDLQSIIGQGPYRIWTTGEVGSVASFTYLSLLIGN